MGVQDGGGDPWGESHTVFIVGTLSQASDTHWKHMCLLSTNHTSEKSLRSRLKVAICIRCFGLRNLQTHVHRGWGCTFAHSCPGRDPG